MDMTTLIVIIVVIALVMYFMNRNRMAQRGPTYGNQDPYARGNERPTYDDPGYTSSGSIGGSPSGGVEIPQDRTAGGLHTPTSGASGLNNPSPRNDDPNYRSGGSIGG